MVVIGSVRFDVEGAREFSPEEIADIFADNGLQIFGDTLMYNNNVGWGWLPAACIPYKKEGSIYFEPDRDVYFGEDANEGSAAMYQLLCDTLKDKPFLPYTEKTAPILYEKNADRIRSYVTMHGGDDEEEASFVFLFADKEHDVYDESFRVLFSDFLRYAGIRTFRSLKKAAKTAKEMYQEDTDSTDDPFDLGMYAGEMVVRIDK